MAEAERTVSEAERLASLWSSADHSPYFRMAWRRIIESTAHDSVVGSGTDETVAQVCARLEEAAQAPTTAITRLCNQQGGITPVPEGVPASPDAATETNTANPMQARQYSP